MRLWPRTGNEFNFKNECGTSFVRTEIMADVEHTDVSSASSMDVDFIVTNRELADSLAGVNAKIIIVNNYFDRVEIKNALKENLE